jgi:predicted Zn-dependent protease
MLTSALYKQTRRCSSRSNFLAPRKNTGSNSSSHQGLPTYFYIIGGTSGCIVAYNYFSNLDYVPITNRRRWIATTPQYEQLLGDQEYARLVQELRGQILPRTHRASQTVARVGARIARASKEFQQQTTNSSDDPTKQQQQQQKPFTFTVVRSDMANAFCLPGNHIFVMTGLFQYATNEDELACVIGHEVAHTLCRHAGERMSGSLVTSVLARMTFLIDPTGLTAALFLPAAAVLRELPHSRSQEMEADQIGVRLAALACYDPRFNKNVFAAMKRTEVSSGAPPQFLSTHPSHESRISNFDKWLPEAMAIYENNERCADIRRQMERARLAAARDAAMRETTIVSSTMGRI